MHKFMANWIYDLLKENNIKLVYTNFTYHNKKLRSGWQSLLTISFLNYVLHFFTTFVYIKVYINIA